MRAVAMTRSGLRSAARAVEAHPEGPTPGQAPSDPSDKDDGEVAPDAKLRRLTSASQPTNRPTPQDERQLRPRMPGAHEGDHQEQRPGKKRRAVVEVQLPRKRRAGLRSSAAETSAASKSTKLDGQGSRGETSESIEQQNGSREAEEQLQKELREHDPYDFEGSNSDAGDGGQQGRTSKSRGKNSALPTKARAKAKSTKGSQQQRSGSVDLATPVEEQAAASPTPDERDGDENDDDVSEGDEAGSGEIVTVTISSGPLEDMVKLMGDQGWTKEGRQYAQTLLPEEDEPTADWLARIGEPLQGLKRCKDLYAEVRDLLKLFQAIPKFPDLSGQMEHIGKQREVLKKAVDAIPSSMEGIVADMKKAISKAGRKANRRPRSVEETIKSLYLKIIPLLVLCLKQAFQLGTQAAIEDDIPANGEFIACTIRLQLLTVRQIAFLYNVLVEQVEQMPPTCVQGAEMEGKRAKTEAKQRRELRTHLGKFQARLEEMNEALKRYADDQKRHQLEEAARQERQRLKEEEREFRRLLWLESLRRPLRNEHYSKHGWQQRNGYYDKHGWYEQEDEKVLETLQEAASPDFFALQALLPHRSVEELQDRADQLRESSRLKFEHRGWPAPAWCYASEARR